MGFPELCQIGRMVRGWQISSGDKEHENWPRPTLANYTPTSDTNVQSTGPSTSGLLCPRGKVNFSGSAHASSPNFRSGFNGALGDESHHTEHRAGITPQAASIRRRCLKNPVGAGRRRCSVVPILLFYGVTCTFLASWCSASARGNFGIREQCCSLNKGREKCYSVTSCVR